MEIPMVTTDNIRVTVHYMAAGKPFEQDFSRLATIEEVKSVALDQFGLKEGVDPEGNTVTYPLYQQKTPLENPNQTVGELAGHQKVLQLKLSQQITQG